MMRENAMLYAAGLLLARKPAFEKELRKKVTSLLLSLGLKEAREIASAGADGYFQTIIENMEMPLLLKTAKKLDPHLPGRDAMPEAWLRAHVRKLILVEAEPASAIKKATKQKAAKVPGGKRRSKPATVPVAVNG